MKNIKIYIVMFLEALLFTGVIIFITNQNKNVINKLNTNITASNDTIHSLQIKNINDSVRFKESYLLKVNELEDNIGISKQYINNLQSTLNDKINYIANIKSSINIDTIIHTQTDTMYIDKYNNKNIKWSWSNEWINISGINDFGNNAVSLTNIDINTNAKVGLTKDNKFFIISDNPYIHYTSIQGATIDKSNFVINTIQKFNIGIQMGFGVTANNHGYGFGPYAGLGIGIKF